jgi:hypothetical protein
MGFFISAGKLTLAKTIETVDQFMTQLKHPHKDAIEQIRAVVLASHKQVTEQIKWNAPSFGLSGEDRITFRLDAKNGVQLIFHRGAKVRKDNKSFEFKDSTGLLEWITNDRATLTFTDAKDFAAKGSDFEKVVKQWLKASQ